MILRLLLSTLIVTLWLCSSWAKEERVVDMQWAPVQGAVSYEFELFQSFGGKFVSNGVDKINVPNWSKKLNPGSYQFRIRSIDYRGVAGLWSDKKLFIVKLPNPIPVRPLDGETIIAKRDDQEDVQFQWQNVIGAEYYYLKVEDQNGSVAYQGKLSESYKIITLNVARSYSWKVWALSGSDDKLDPNVTAMEFKLLGGILDAPELDLETTDSRLQLLWSQPPNTTSFYYEIYKKNGREWRKLMNREKYTKTILSFVKNKIRPGHYRFSVQALGENRGSSSKTTMDFLWTGKKADKIDYKEGEKKDDNKSDFEKRSNLWLALAYMDMPQLAYAGEVKETNTAITNVISGQRVGFDLVRKFKDSSWRTATQFMYKTYVALKTQWNLIDLDQDLRYVKRYSSGEWGFGLGVFINQHPVLVADKTDTTKLVAEKLTIFGEKLRLSAGLYLTDNIQALMDINLLLNTIGLTVPQGSGDLSMTMSQTMNFWLGYIYKDVVQFRVGYSIFNMAHSYQAGPSSYGTTGQLNTSNYTGSALKFGAGLSF